MRTTVEISDEQHFQLVQLAAKKGMRGFSNLVQEAIDQYLESQNNSAIATALAAEGILTSQEADKVQERIDEAWRSWNAPA